MTEDECLLLSSAEEDVQALWEAALLGDEATYDKERGEPALRSLLEKGLVSLKRTKSWRDQIETPLTPQEHQLVLETLHDHEDWNPSGDVHKSYISFSITPKGKELFFNSTEIRQIFQDRRQRLMHEKELNKSDPSDL